MSIELLVLTVVYATYHLSLFPSIPGGDSGELVAEACQLGVPHPPGYPLFTMLSRLAIRLPATRFTLNGDGTLGMDYQPSPAWKVNHMCCLFGAFTSVFVGKSAALVLRAMLNGSCGDLSKPNSTSGSYVSFLASMLFAFSPLVWEYAITAEVFALNNFLCALLLWLTLQIIVDLQGCADPTSTRVPESHIRNKVWCGALTSSLALCNQHASLLHISFLIVVVTSALFTYKYPGLVKLITSAAAIFFIGLSPYAYLVYASQNIPAGSWGDTTNLQGFLKHVLRAEYGTFRLGGIVGKESWVQRIILYLQFVSRESYHAMFPILAIAILVATLHVLRNAATSTKTSLTKGAPRVLQQHGNKQSKSKKSNASSSSSTIQVAPSSVQTSIKIHLTLVGVVLATWLVYLFAWHCVFSNLPLSAPMPYGVHARFWMQPGIALHVLLGLAIGILWHALSDSLSVLKRATIEISVLILVTAFLLRHQFPLSNRSHTGDILSKYAYASMSVVTPYSLVLSHSDLDWNPMRYIRLCENAYGDRNITHLSAQILPYPWFPRQLVNYKQFRLPDVTFRGVSTDRYSEGNARLLINLLTANGVTPSPQPISLINYVNPVFPGGVFIEMQAINEAEIGNSGKWRNIYTLVPWGSQYRVFPLLNGEALERVQKWSVDALQQFLFEFGPVTRDILDNYPLGTWEAGAISVYYDAQYQVGLNLLTFFIESSADKSFTGAIERVAILLDRLTLSQHIMSSIVENVLRYETINSGIKDVVKNTALANLRLLHMLLGLPKIEKALRQVCEALNSHNEATFLDYSRLMSILAEEGRKSVIDEARLVIKLFLNAYPDDPDYNVFYAMIR